MRYGNIFPFSAKKKNFKIAFLLYDLVLDL